MRFSALIASYNSARTIVASIESVLAQTLAPDEIIVLLDGEVDDTAARIEHFKPRIKVLIQENQGIARARNNLCLMATGDILAFLDSDDLWHPEYLKTQREIYEQFPQAVGSFTGHLRFRGADHVWTADPVAKYLPELIAGSEFMSRYNTTTAVFGSMSYTCVRKSAVDKMGSEPFSDLRAAEDSYLCYQMTLQGPVVFQPAKLVAYRLTDGSLSENRVRNLGLWVNAFERLEGRFMDHATKPLLAAFYKYFASKRREYAKILLAVDRTVEARTQLLWAMCDCWNPISLFKSMVILMRSYLPKRFHPHSEPVRVLEGNT